jgi:hypothetical protein
MFPASSVLLFASVFAFAATAVTGAPAAVDDGEPPGIELSTPDPYFLEEETRAPAATEYWRAPASAFVQYDDANAWTYYNGGCIHRTGGSNYFDIDLQLPDAATITYLRVYFYDTDATYDASALIWSFDGAGNSTLLATVSSAGTPGQSTAGTSVSHVVNNVNEALSVRIDFNGASTSSVRICGVRVQYVTP